MKEKVSLKDIAEILGLSKTTVSWVLSNQGDKKGVSEATQNLVYECADRLNYQPNHLARSLNTGTTKTIGLILPSISDSFYSSVAKGIVSEVEKHGYTLMIGSSESDIIREEKMVRAFKMKHVDGIILAPMKHSKEEIENLLKENFPFTLFDRSFDELNTNSVMIENENASYQLVKHLINKGLRKIAILTTNTHLNTLKLRHNGYLRALREARIAPDPRLLGETLISNYEEYVPVILDRIYKEVPDVEGFFFATHILAIESFNYFAKKGININKGTNFCCMHTTAGFNILAPEMSIAHMPTTDIGRNAVRLLLKEIDAIKGENIFSEKEKILLPCDIELH